VAVAVPKTASQTPPARPLPNGGPDFKFQAQSVIRIDDVDVKPVKNRVASAPAAGEAVRVGNAGSHRTSRSASNRTSRGTNPVTSSAATEPRDNRSPFQERNKKPPKSPAPVQDDSVWEFNAPSRRRSCCAIL
jgi:hypothetical protein